MKKQNKNQPLNPPQKKVSESKIKNNIKKTKTNSGSISSKIPVLKIISIVLIIAATFIAYYPSLDNEFTNWDDNGYVLENPTVQKLSWANVKQQFQQYDMGNYHPLTMVTLAIDYHFSEVKPPEKRDDPPQVNPKLFHRHNLLLHIVNSVLIFFFVFNVLIFYNQTNKTNLSSIHALIISLISAVLFGVSTLHVESVAWVAERKDVLYTAFFFASLLGYVQFLKTRKIVWILLSIVSFTLSLLAKGQAVSLAVTLLAIDFLLKRNLLSKSVILEKIPYFVLAFIFGVVAIFAQKHGEAIHDITEYPYFMRLFFASYSYVMYLVKLIYPFGLAAIYPYPAVSGSTQMPVYIWFFIIPAALIVYVLVRSIKRSPLLAYGIAFYTINIFLLLQFLPVGSAVMADRYSYIPSLGLFFLIGYGFVWLIDKLQPFKWLFAALLTAYTCFIGYKTYQQCDVWKDSIMLWETSLQNSPNALVGWNNYGSALQNLKRFEFTDNALQAMQQRGVNQAIIEKLQTLVNKAYYSEDLFFADVIQQIGNGNATALRNIILRYTTSKLLAIEAFSRAIELKPDYTHAIYNRGTSKKDIGVDYLDSTILRDALTDFDLALKIDPAFTEAYHNRGITKENLNQLEAAIEDYSKALEIDPKLHKLYSSRGVAKGKMGRLEEAIEDFNKGLEVEPQNPEAYSNRGFAKVQLDRIEEGIKDYDKAIEINPVAEEAIYNRALAHFQLKQYEKALADYNRLLQISPNHTDGIRNRAFNLYTMKRWEAAIADYDYLLQNNPNDYTSYYYRGISRIEAGQKAQGCTDLQRSAQFGLDAAKQALVQYCK